MSNTLIVSFIIATILCSANCLYPLSRLNLFGPSDFCTERQCREPPTVPVTLTLVVNAVSPLYVSVLPKNCKNKHIDNVCYTFFDLGYNFFLVYQSVVYCDHSNTLYSHIEVDVPGSFGVLRGSDPTCTYQEYVLQLGCESNFLLYRCFTFGECNRDVVTIDPGYDSIYALANVNKFTSSCQETLIKQIQGTVGFNVTEHVALPNKLDNKCVALFNGAKCIGYEKLDEKDMISVDTQGNSITDKYKEELDEILGKVTNSSG